MLKYLLKYFIFTTIFFGISYAALKYFVYKTTYLVIGWEQSGERLDFLQTLSKAILRFINRNPDFVLVMLAVFCLGVSVIAAVTFRKK